MAYYHERLQYHEDTIKKRSLTKEDVDFLKDLQKEMNTQDTLGQADPRFWVIKGSEKIYGFEDGYEDGTEVFFNGNCMGEGMDAVFEYIRDSYTLDTYNVYIEKYTDITGRDSRIIKVCDEDGEMEYAFDNVMDVCEWIKDVTGDAFSLTNYRIEEKIYSNTMFLTQKDAENHLKANSHHYSEDAHTYAMTASRSPRVGKLYKILQEIDWDRVPMVENLIINGEGK